MNLIWKVVALREIKLNGAFREYPFAISLKRSSRTNVGNNILLELFET